MGSIDVAGPAGRLEGLLEEVAEPRFAALVCHPHPSFGGTMHNHATYRIARGARAAGGVTLRFNFRGVGRSAGSYDRGRGEAADAAAALALLAERYPTLPLPAGGFSFGAFAALTSGLGDPGVRGLVLAGLVVHPRDDLPRGLGPLVATPLPAAVLQAGQDEFGTPDDVRRALEGSKGARRVVPIDGAPHLFTGRLDALEAAAAEATAWVLTER